MMKRFQRFFSILTLIAYFFTNITNVYGHSLKDIGILHDFTPGDHLRMMVKPLEDRQSELSLLFEHIREGAKAPIESSEVILTQQKKQDLKVLLEAKKSTGTFFELEGIGTFFLNWDGSLRLEGSQEHHICPFFVEASKEVLLHNIIAKDMRVKAPSIFLSGDNKIDALSVFHQTKDEKTLILEGSSLTVQTLSHHMGTMINEGELAVKENGVADFHKSNLENYGKISGTAYALKDVMRLSNDGAITGKTLDLTAGGLDGKGIISFDDGIRGRIGMFYEGRLETKGKFDLVIDHIYSGRESSIKGNGRITLKKGFTRGAILGHDLTLDIVENIKSYGTLDVKRITGLGVLENAGLIAPSSMLEVTIKKLQNNGGIEAPHGMTFGLDDQKTTFEQDEKGRLEGSDVSFKNALFKSNGGIKTDKLALATCESTNNGVIDTKEIDISKGLFTNDVDGVIDVHEKTNLWIELLTNKGYWTAYGAVEGDVQRFSQGGTFHALSDLTLKGHTLENTGTLRVDKKASIDYDTLINHKNLWINKINGVFRDFSNYYHFLYHVGRFQCLQRKNFGLYEVTRDFNPKAHASLAVTIPTSLPVEPWDDYNSGTFIVKIDPSYQFIHKNYRLINEGYISILAPMSGSIELLHNKKSGKLHLQDAGALTLSSFLNDGAAMLGGDTVTKNQALKRIINKGSLLLTNSYASQGFDSIINENDMALVGCSMTVGTFVNKGRCDLKDSSLAAKTFNNHGKLYLLGGDYLLSIADLQALKENLLATTNSLWMQQYQNSGEIYLDNGNLTIEETDGVASHNQAPSLLSQGGSAPTEKTHAPKRGLGTIITPGNITWKTCPHSFLSSIKDLVIGGNLHITGTLCYLQEDCISTTIQNLYIICGAFYTDRLLEVPSLTLITSEKTTLGKDNDHMGTLKTTKGPLEIKANEIDARYGKILSMDTLALNGTSKLKLGDFKNVKQTGRTVNVGVNVSLPEYDTMARNGSFVAAVNGITLRSENPILLTFADIQSTTKGIIFQGTQGTLNTSSRIQANHDIEFFGPYTQTRPNQIALKGYGVYPYDCWGDWYAYVESGCKPEMMTQETVIFHSIESFNKFGDILAGKKISIVLEDKKEQTFSASQLESREEQGGAMELRRHKKRMVCAGWHSNTFGQTIACMQAGQKITIDGGIIKLSGMISAPSIAISGNDSNVSALPCVKKTFIPENITVNVTKFIQEMLKDSGFYTIDDKKTIVPALPMTPYSPTKEQRLVMGDAPTENLITFNPLSKIDLSPMVLNVMADYAHQVFTKDQGDQDLLSLLYKNTQKWRHDHDDKALITEEEAKKSLLSMFFTKLEQVGKQIQETLYLIISKDDINPFHESGDIFGKDVHIQAKETLKGSGARIVGDNKLVIESKTLDLKSIAERISTTFGFEEKPVTCELRSPQGEMLVKTKENTTFTGVDKEAKKATFVIGGIFVDLASRLHSDSTVRDGKTTTHTHTITPHVPHYKVDDLTIFSKGMQFYEAPQMVIKKGILVSDDKVTITDVHKIVQVESETQKTSGHGVFKKEKTTHDESITQTPIRPSFEGENLVINAPGNITIVGANFDVDKTELESKDGVVRLLASLSESQSVRVEKSKSTWWQQISQNVDHITKAHPVTTRGTITVSAKEIDVEGIRGQVLDLLKHLDIKDGVLNEKYITEICVHEHKKVEGPTKALVAVVALAVTLATMGAGTELGLGLTSAMGLQGGASATVAGMGTVTGASVVEGISTATATGLGAVSLSAGSAIAEGIASLTVAQSTVAATTAAVIQGMTQGAFTALCSRSAVSLLENRGNVGHVLKDLTSKESLKGIGISSLTQGVTNGMAKFLDMPLSHVKGFMPNLEKQMLSHSIGASINASFGDRHAFDHFFQNVVVDTVGAIGATEIGESYSKGDLDVVSHKLAHAFLGGTMGGVLEGKRGILSGAESAILAESLMELTTPARVLGQSDEAYHKVLEQNRDIVRILVATVNLCARNDIGLGDRVSKNAIENNFMENVREVFLLDEDDSIFQTKQEKGTKEALEELQERQEIVRKEELVEYGKDIAYLAQYIVTHPGETMDFVRGKVQEGFEFSMEHPFDAMKNVGTEVGLWFLPTAVFKSVSGVVKVGQMARAFKAMRTVEEGVVVGKEARGAFDLVEGAAKIVVEDAKVVKEVPEQVHHFATNKHSRYYTEQMEKIVEPFGLKLDGAWNKAKMPHQGSHPHKYHDFVLKGMKDASEHAGSDPQKFIQLFDEYVKKPVLENPELLNKSWWK